MVVVVSKEDLEWEFVVSESVLVLVPGGVAVLLGRVAVVADELDAVVRAVQLSQRWNVG